jgi:hypothetical protein
MTIPIPLVQKACKEAFKTYHIDSGPGVICSPRKDLLASVSVEDATNTVFVAFRGTCKTKNWLTNFKALQQNWDGMEVHCGFLKAYKKLQHGLLDLVAKVVESLVSRGRQVHLVSTGHSLGGALASLFIVDSKKVPVDANRYLITFSKPCVGNAKFNEEVQKCCNNKAHNYYVDGDVVTEALRAYVFPGSVFGTYVEDCEEINLDPNQTVWEPDQEQNKQMVMEVVKAWVEVWMVHVKEGGRTNSDILSKLKLFKALFKTGKLTLLQVMVLYTRHEENTVVALVNKGGPWKTLSK